MADHCAFGHTDVRVFVWAIFVLKVRRCAADICKQKPTGHMMKGTRICLASEGLFGESGE